MKSFYPIIIIGIIILFLNEIIKRKKENKLENTYESYPYKKIKYLLTIAEKNFYDVLNNVLEDTEYYICPKVRLADIVSVEKTDKRQSYFNKIKSKHVDFLLCNRKSLEPLIVIELDDSSHNKSDRIERDNFLDKVLEASEIKILRFKVKKSYNVLEIKEKLNITI